MQRNKLLLLFPDGVGIRNYIYTDVFAADDELVLLHNFNSETIDYLKQYKSIDSDIVIPEYTESAKEKFLRELIALSRLYRNIAKTGNKTLLVNWVWKQKTLQKKLFYKAVEMLAPFCKSDSSIATLDKKYQKAIRNNPFYDEVKGILEKVKPTTVFCSHQRGLKAATIFAAAQDLKIPTVTVIYSWDNLPKGRLALQADRYLVWSEHMKNEMALFFPEVPQHKVVVSGTPQFEFYGDQSNIIDRQIFFETYKLDPGKKTICFSGDDEMTSPDDPKYLDDLAQAITEAGLHDQYQILMRRCPVDLSRRYESVIQKHGALIKEAPPLWNDPGLSGWTGLYPLFDDVKLLVSTAFYCDAVVNIGSTMAFDFAMFDKPSCYINYDQKEKQDPDWSVDKVYRFQHFKSMEGLNPVGWINSKSEIASVIQKAVNAPQTIGPDRKKWMARVVENPLASNFETITKSLPNDA